MNIRTEIWNGHKIRFVEVEPNDWWAVAKDVSDSLGYDKTRNMTRFIDARDKGEHKVSTLGGTQEMTVLSEFGIYDAVFRSNKKEAKEFKRWVFEMLKELRQSSGLEGFQVFRTLDKEYQKEQMSRLSQSLKEPKRINFIKANTIANKAISSKYGYSKMIKKKEMSPDMLIERQPILDDTVNLMSVADKFGLGISVSDEVYKKYIQ